MRWRLIVLSSVASALITGALFLLACAQRSPGIDLEEVEVLPELCLPIPRGFRREEGYGITLRTRDVIFSHWGWRYPEWIGVSQLDDESQASTLIRSQINKYCNCDWQREVPDLNNVVRTIGFRDNYAGSDAQIVATIKAIDGRKYLVWAYCRPARGYCETFVETVPQLRSCGAISHYLPVADSRLIPTSPPPRGATLASTQDSGVINWR